MDILLYVNFIPKTAIDDLYVKVFRDIRTIVILKCIFKDNQWLYECPDGYVLKPGIVIMVESR